MPRGVFPAAIIASLLTLVAVAAGLPGGSAIAGGNGNGNGPDAVPPEIQADFDADGVVEVIVALKNEDVLNALRARTGNGRANGQAQREAAQEFKGRNDQVVAGLPADSASVERYDQFGAFSLTVTDQRTLDFLARHPLVKGLEPLREVDTLVASSLPFINQGGVAGAGLTGSGASVAIVDTGINYTHPFFGPCTSPGTPGGTCRVPFATDFAPDDGALDAMGHGTNVAGIAGSVAPGAGLLSLDVFNGNTASTTDILEGLNWVIANASTYNTKSVNLSLGGAVYNNQSSCDLQSSGTLNAFTSLRINGVLPVVAAGNNANKNGVTWPGCVSGAHAVGAVYDGDYGPRNWGACGMGGSTAPDDASTAADQVTCFSNSHATLLDSLAPGTFIDVAGTLNYSGTSMAAPHVAGAVAALSNAPATLAQVENTLNSTGPLTTDTNGVAKHRLDLCQAAASYGPRDPEFSSTPITNVLAGHAYSYKLLACGFGLNVTFQLIDGPPGLSLNSGLISWTPTAANVGVHQVTVRVQSSQGSNDQTWNLEVKPFSLLFALQNSQTLSGVTMADEDIVSFEGTSFSQFFDGSDVGIGATEIAAFEVIDSDEVLLVFRGPETIPGAGSVDDSDIVKFTGTPGPTTSGTFSVYLDGSDVGLAGGTFSDTEKIDALGLRPNGNLLISTNGTVNVTGASGAGEDILQFAPQGLGATTTGTWSVYWDGSDIGLSGTAENLDGISLLDSALYLSSTGDFSVPGANGQNDDVFFCSNFNSGSTTACLGWGTFFDGGLFNLGNNNLVDIDFPPPPPAPVAPTITSTALQTATAGQQYSYQATATGTSPITWALDTAPTGMTVSSSTGLVSWTPDSGAIGDHQVILEATNIAGTTQQPFTVTVSEEPVAPPAQLYFSVANDGTVGSPALSVANEDILAFDGTSFSIFFDGSAEGLSGFAVDAFAIINSDEILFSFTAGGSVPDIAGTTDDSDVVKYTISTGTFSMYFDGSDVGLDQASEDIDAIHFISNNRLALSTTGAVTTSSGFSAVAQDVIRFTFADGSSGANTAGAWRMWWDGSDVGLTVAGENIDAASLTGGKLYLSTSDAFSVTGVSGADEDVFICDDPSTGPTSVCPLWSAILFFDGSVHGLGSNDVVAVSVP